jgi:hypothetical protein
MNGAEKLVRKMQKGQHTLKELGISFHDILHLRATGYNVSSQHTERGQVYYITLGSENVSHFISGLSPQENTEKWVELSDIHAGSKMFDEQGLRNCLYLACKEGFKVAHISGDLCDGKNVYPLHANNLQYFFAEEQAGVLASILSEFPLHYIAITGNHDRSFERDGNVNPISLVQQMINESKQAKFTFLNSFAGDLVIQGTVKRMVHLFGGRAYAKSYPAQTYIRNLLDSHNEHVHIRGNKYRLKFLQMGHYHTDIAFEAAGIYITHPGNFQFPNDFTIRLGLIGYQGCRFTTVVIKNGAVLDYNSRFVTPRR